MAWRTLSLGLLVAAGVKSQLNSASPNNDHLPALTTATSESVCYANRYADLKKAFCQPGCNTNALHQHFERHGLREGRYFGCGETPKKNNSSAVRCNSGVLHLPDYVPYEIVVVHGYGNMPGKEHHGGTQIQFWKNVYAPGTGTIIEGLQAWEAECGYKVSGPELLDRAFSSRKLRSGDVLIHVGAHNNVQLGTICQKSIGVTCVLYWTEPSPIKLSQQAMSSIKEIWHYSFSSLTRHGLIHHNQINRFVPPGFVSPKFPLVHSQDKMVFPFKFLFLGQMTQAAEFRQSCWQGLEKNPYTANQLEKTYGVTTEADWQDIATRVPQVVFLNIHRLKMAEAPLESFRLTTLLSLGAVVVTQASIQADLDAFEGIVIVEKDMCGATWSQQTTDLLGSPDKLDAWRNRSRALFKERFDPKLLLTTAGVWSE